MLNTPRATPETLGNLRKSSVTWSRVKISEKKTTGKLDAIYYGKRRVREGFYYINGGWGAFHKCILENISRHEGLMTLFALRDASGSMNYKDCALKR